MKQIIIILAVLFIGCSATGQVADPDTTIVEPAEPAPTAELADTTAKPAPPPVLFNQFIGTRRDTFRVLIEFAAIREATPENDITRYMTHLEYRLVKTQDVWRNSLGTVREDYYEQLGGQWVKANPVNVIRITPLQR